MAIEVYRARRRFHWGAKKFGTKMVALEFSPPECLEDCKETCWKAVEQRQDERGRPFTYTEDPKVFKLQDGTMATCNRTAGEACVCNKSACRCQCGIAKESYAGDVWPVNERDPRKQHILMQRFATGDAAIQPVPELMKDRKFAEIVAATSAAA